MGVQPSAPDTNVELETVRARLSALAEQDGAESMLDAAMQLIGALQSQKSELELKLLAVLRERSGRRTEKIDARQLALMLDVAESDDAASDDDADDDDDAGAPPSDDSKPARRPRRRPLPKHLPRQRFVHELDENERACRGCGDVMGCIGHDTSEQLAVIPARFEVHEHHRAKYACGRCKDTVVTAPGPDKVIERGLPDASLIAHVAVSKYEDHTPLNRLARIYGRHGVQVPVSTLADWVTAAARELTPLVALIEAQVKRAHLVQTDASGLKVLDRDDVEGIRRGTMWCYVGDRDHVLFRYAPTGEGETGPWRLLAGRTGYVQADASNTFDRLFNGRVANAVEVGCMAHARRRFFKLKDTDRRVAYPLQLIQKLYAVERAATERECSAEERVVLREKRTRKILAKLHSWLVKTVSREPPKSALHQACAYSLNHWQALTRFMEDGQLTPDNNLCELQIRSLAVGRKNYLFAGSDAGAERAAVLYSILRTCARNDVDPMEYVADVLRKLAAGWPEADLPQLLPAAWKERFESSEPLRLKLPEYARLRPSEPESAEVSDTQPE